ncbi:MAG: protein translocase component YidC [Chloroflexi bacterium]|nr:MAG: protein translocase component YidC [Chloroflexota bacterium]
MWDLLIINPMTNALLWLYAILGNNFVLAITVFTILIRLLTLPLNIRQQRSSMKMQKLQPQIQAIQKKYRDNPQKMQEEFQKIGYNPAETLGGCLPLLIQMPVLFGLFQVLRLVLSSTPQSLFLLTQRVYPGIDLSQLLPISNRFLWMNLGQPDPLFVLPVLVFATMYLQQKFLSPTANRPQADNKKQQDDPTAAMTQSMQYTMPIMFGFFSLQFQAGLSIYFVLSNIIGIFQGVYMRQVMAREAEAEAQTAVSAPSDAIPEPEPMPDPEPIDESQAPAANNKPPKKTRPQSKRKRRSGKR